MSSAVTMTCQIRTYDSIAAACRAKNLVVPPNRNQTVNITEESGRKYPRTGIVVDLQHGGEKVVFNPEKGEYTYAWQDMHSHKNQDRAAKIRQFIDQAILEHIKIETGLEGYQSSEEQLLEDGTLLCTLSN